MTPIYGVVLVRLIFLLESWVLRSELLSRDDAYMSDALYSLLLRSLALRIFHSYFAARAVLWRMLLRVDTSFHFAWCRIGVRMTDSMLTHRIIFINAHTVCSSIDYRPLFFISTLIKILYRPCYLSNFSDVSLRWVFNLLYRTCSTFMLILTHSPEVFSSYITVSYDRFPYFRVQLLDKFVFT